MALIAEAGPWVERGDARYAGAPRVLTCVLQPVLVGARLAQVLGKHLADARREQLPGVGHAFELGEAAIFELDARAED